VLAGTQIRVKTPSELVTKTGARMMAITLPDSYFGAFLTIPASGGRFLEMFRSELRNNLTPGDNRALGSCLPRFQSLVELPARKQAVTLARGWRLTRPCYVAGRDSAS
jgi:hypothetical protein